jgi:glutamate/tyrosine decarboxylase-like PLP-dependent enzyme
MDREELGIVFDHAARFIQSLPERPVRPEAAVAELRTELGLPLQPESIPAADVIRDLIAAAEPGLMGTTSPRFFGFVIGGTTPVALAADWLTTLWDQNAGLYASAPAASVAEETAARWLVDVLGLPPGTSTGFVTGGQMANFTCLAAARDHVLAEAGWDVERDGLQGAPRIRVIAGEERHSTIDRALRYLGLGETTARLVPADEQGRMRPDALEETLVEEDAPTIVCAQAGNVNSGSFDPLRPICEMSRQAGAWVHVDGAFGLWAAASPRLAHLLDGHDLADSWATDGHKWLNVPYDSGFAFCARPEAHRRAMQVHASYLIHAEDAERDPMDWNPEFSRRARGFAVYAAMRALGRGGITEMIERGCDNARRFADRLATADGVEVLNEVVLNQVLVAFGDDERTQEVVRRVQADGTCWLSGSRWRGRAVMRISVSNWATTADDVDRSVGAILAAAEAAQRLS